MSTLERVRRMVVPVAILTEAVAEAWAAIFPNQSGPRDQPSWDNPDTTSEEHVYEDKRLTY